MKITQIVGLVNTKLAGETLTYNQMLSFLDDTVNDINTHLNACFPTFSEITTSILADSVYDAIPDQYITSVVVIGTAYKFYTTDEEGINVATGYQQEYERGLFYMVRDYSASVPEQYQAKNRGYVEGTAPSGNAEGLGEPFCRYPINPDLRYVQGPRGEKGEPGAQGEEGPQGERGNPGVYIGAQTPPEDVRVWVCPDGNPSPYEIWTFLLKDGSTTTRKVWLHPNEGPDSLEEWVFDLEDGTTVVKKVRCL